MKVAVLGAGSWGTALAIHCARRGIATTLWARDPEVVASVANRRHHPRRFPGEELPANLAAAGDLVCAADADLLLLAVPSAAVWEVLALLPEIRRTTVFVSAVKGFEISSGKRISEIVRERVPANPFAVISGPTFAQGVVAGDPTAAVVASADPKISSAIQETISDSRFRLYTSSDVTGVELLGGLKNVSAIAAGIATGMGLGHNTLASLATRGLAEMARLVLARGGRERTVLGLAGVGDLMLTCTGEQSRNRRLGVEIGRGRPPRIAMEELPEVAEGTLACLAAERLSRDSGVEMPVAAAVRRILYEGLAPRDAIEKLMTRELKPEWTLKCL